MLQPKLVAACALGFCFWRSGGFGGLVGLVGLVGLWGWWGWLPGSDGIAEFGVLRLGGSIQSP
ncbi:hypothetical protein J42TS3_30600 [Paenibacillus vini]|uniref:Uncharacterized protein n=1 Tax=Paenibacillus vini TaxID=1476024 RepID=A0ABQ4MF38_9BACL|nr:hypothetical protein J42TS3_30600 [Paenibacillus vini]